MANASKASQTVHWSHQGKSFSAHLPLFCTSRTSGQNIQNICIGLHGYGDSAANFSGLSEELILKDVLWVFPQAPFPVPMSADGAQWYNLFGPSRQDIETSHSKITELVNTLSRVSEIPHHKIFLMGFSQGAYLTLYSGLRNTPALAGIIALSGYVGQSHRLAPLTPAQKQTPVYLAHGLQDQVVLPAAHFETLDLLNFLGFTKVTSNTFPMGHSVHPQELQEITQFIEENR